LSSNLILPNDYVFLILLDYYEVAKLIIAYHLYYCFLFIVHSIKRSKVLTKSYKLFNNRSFK